MFPKHASSRFMVFLVVLVTTELFASSVVAQTNTVENSYRVRSGSTTAFPPDDRLKLANEATIEFRFNHRFGLTEFEQWYQGAQDPDLKKDNVGFSKPTYQPYTVLISSGTPDDLEFAVYLLRRKIKGQLGDEITWFLGVANTLDDIGNPQKMRALPKPELGLPIPRRAKNYHIAIRKEAGRNALDLFLDGAPLGEVQANLGQPSRGALHIGWDYGPLSHEDSRRKSRFTQSWTLDGQIGALRLWERALGDQAVYAMFEYGISPDVASLTRIQEYCDLLAVADFRGIEWDTRSNKWTDSNKVRLLFPEKLAGVWRELNMGVRPVKDRGLVDFPVYTFVPEERTDASTSTYQVFEDGNFLGRMRLDERYRSEDQGWRAYFAHTENWNGPRGRISRKWPTFIPFIARRVKNRSNNRYELKLVCDAMPAEIPKPLAGRKAGERLVFQRTTFDALKIANFNPELWDAIAKQEAAEGLGDTDLNFNLNLQYKDLMYRGYNIAYLNDFDLAERRRNTRDPYILQVPSENTLFHTDRDKLRRIPFDLDLIPLERGKTDTSSVFFSNGMEYNYSRSTKIGAGLEIGVNATPIGVGLTASYSLVGQLENAKDQVAISRDSVNLLVTNSTYEDYILYHKKDVMRLDSTGERRFVDVVRQLQRDVSTAGPATKARKFYDFFEQWGTHYPFGGTFGSMGQWETRMDENVIEKLEGSLIDAGVTINRGENSLQSSVSERLTREIETQTTRARTVGSGGSPSDQQRNVEQGTKLIRVDLRPMYELLTPQHFPNEPNIYHDLHQQMISALPVYLSTVRSETLGKLKEEVKQQSASSNNRDRLTVEDVERYEEMLAKYEAGTLKPTRKRKVAIRLRGLAFEYYVKMKEEAFLAAMDAFFHELDKVPDEVLPKALKGNIEEVKQELKQKSYKYKNRNGYVDLRINPNRQVNLSGDIRLIPFGLGGAKGLQGEVKTYLENTASKTIWKVSRDEAVTIKSGYPAEPHGFDAANRASMYVFEVPEPDADNASLSDYLAVRVSAQLRGDRLIGPPVDGFKPDVSKVFIAGGTASPQYYYKPRTFVDPKSGKQKTDPGMWSVRPDSGLIWITPKMDAELEDSSVRRTAQVKILDGKVKSFQQPQNGVTWQKGELLVECPIQTMQIDPKTGRGQVLVEQFAVGVVRIEYEYAILPDLKKLLAELNASDGTWGSFQVGVSPPVKAHRVSSVERGVQPPEIAPFYERLQKNSVLGGWTSKRSPEGAVAYFSFDDMTTEEQTASQLQLDASTNTSEPPSQTKSTRLIHDAYLREAPATNVVPRGSNADQPPGPSPHYVDSKLLNKKSFTIHMDFTLGRAPFDPNGRAERAIWEYEKPQDEGTLLARGDNGFKIIRWGSSQNYLQFQSNEVGSRGFKLERSFGNSWNKLICAVDADKREIRLWTNVGSGTIPFPEKFDPGQSAKWFFAERGRAVNGMTDELIFFDRALSWDDIERLKTRPRIP